ncbi:WGR domain-containing protein [Brucella intermedia]|uniref:WGR domain-containing protein n=1 Tax=Brucella intermedia TaxID=94625 RepID=UPI0023625FE9|nr:WGR domain-containing protein [Brucella intermedia]
MSKKEMGPVHLRRIDPSQNMRRFYSLTIQPTLFGGASLIRNWGRIGTNGQTMMETFDLPTQADVAFERLTGSKRRRGYREALVRNEEREPGDVNVGDGQRRG